ncbi:MAG: hypothetical protein HY255_03305 [Betaproteobacteria bacterium]|nr:hypothetical protein [Betaproteobacteria bacterium]
MNWRQKLKSLFSVGSDPGYRGGQGVFMSHAEKRELEVLLRTKLLAYQDRHGPTSLLQPDVFVVVDTSGTRVQQGRPEAGSFLAAIETRSLPSAISLLAMDQKDIVVPRDIVKFFGTEAASAAAAAINRIAATETG